MTRATGGGSRGRATSKERLGLPFGACRPPGPLPGGVAVPGYPRGARALLGSGLQPLPALSCFCRNPLAVSLKGALRAPRGAEARGAGAGRSPRSLFRACRPPPPRSPLRRPGAGRGRPRRMRGGGREEGGLLQPERRRRRGGGKEPSLPPTILPPLRRRSSRPQPSHAGAAGGRQEPRPGLLPWTQGADLDLPNPAGRTMPYESAPPLAIIVGAITAMGGIQALGNWMIYGKPKVS